MSNLQQHISGSDAIPPNYQGIYVRLISIVFAFCLSLAAFSQSIVSSNGQNFEKYQLNHSAYSIIQDSKGYLWIGTTNGVTVYDGFEFEDYKETLTDSGGFKGKAVATILEDRYGNILMGTIEEGLNIFDQHTKIVQNLPTEVLSNGKLKRANITSMVKDDSLGIWMSMGSSILKFNDSKQLNEGANLQYDVDPNEFGAILKLVRTKSGNLYALGNGIFQVTVDSENSINLLPILKTSRVTSLVEVNSTLVASTERYIYVKRPNQDWKIVNPDQPTGTISSLYIGRSNILWISTVDGIGKTVFNKDFEPSSAKFFRFPNIGQMIEDKSGNLFFTSGSNALFKLGWNYNQFQYIELPDQFSNRYVFKFFEDIDGNYWIGSFNGLFKYEPSTGKTRAYLVSDKGEGTIPARGIFDIKEDKNHNVWIATGKGIVKYEKESDSFLRPHFTSGVSDVLSYAISIDSLGYLWFNGNGRLYRCDPASMNCRDFDLAGKVSQIEYDRDLWIWNPGFGLQKFDVSTGTPILKGIYLEDQKGVLNCNWIESDQIGNLWISSTEGVLVFNIKEEKITHHLNTTNGLFQDNAFEVIRSKSGNMWVKQPTAGSIEINPNTMEAESFSPSWIYRPEGSAFSCVNAAGRNGLLFTEGDGGFFIFNPDSLLKNVNAPIISMSSILINGSKVILDKSIEELQHNSNNMEFNYIGIQFDNPKLIQFAHFLQGYDSDWNLVGNSRSARYSSLPPGSYSFLVKAANSDGIWSEEVVLAEFTILPPWWRSNIAYFFYVLSILLLLYQFYRIQLKRRLALAEATRLKEMDDFKNNFFTNITHEFRTPLTVMLGLAHKIESKAGKLIQRNGQQLLNLINEILELAKLESNSSRIHFTQGDIVGYLRYLVESFSSLAQDRGISLTFKSSSDTLSMDFDKEKIQMVLNNLISNALKFTPGGGSISVSLDKIGEMLEIKVIDTGSGIPAENLPKIFERFYQSKSEEHQFSGTGVGLALTRELVRLMDGKINVQSELGKGSHFTVTLPITNWAEKTSEVYAETTIIVDAVEADYENDLEKLQVLVIEDNLDVRYFIRKVLEEKYQVHLAENGKIGIEKAIELIPDLIISDVMMPEKDGLEVTETLKNDLRTSHIPIVLLTAKADIESRLSGLRTGADIYLAKPFNEDELLLNLSNLIELREKIRVRYADGVELPAKGRTREDEFVAGIQTAIHEHLSDDSFGIDEVCREIGVSRTQLHRKLKAISGKSASIFIRDIRLSEGKKMILTSTLTISEIAYSVGFSDPNYFTKLYSEKYGAPPSSER